jgi:hypothetical protein
MLAVAVVLGICQEPPQEQVESVAAAVAEIAPDRLVLAI